MSKRESIESAFNLLLNEEGNEFGCVDLREMTIFLYSRYKIEEDDVKKWIAMEINAGRLSQAISGASCYVIPTNK